MAAIHAELLTPAEVRNVALPILRNALEEFGFNGDVTLAEEEDFDGSQVIRMTARVQEKVPATRLADALEAIHAALRDLGEERFVYLSTVRPGNDDVDEDVD